MTEATITCPKCAYERTEADTAPSTECPSCGVIYAKVGQIVARPRVVKPAAPPNPSPATELPKPLEPQSHATSLATTPPPRNTNPAPTNGLIRCDACDNKISPRAATCPHCGDPINGTPDAPGKVAISDINIPFWSMVGFMVRWAFATIPALIIVVIVVLFLSVFFGGIGQFFSILGRH